MGMLHILVHLNTYYLINIFCYLLQDVGIVQKDIYVRGDICYDSEENGLRKNWRLQEKEGPETFDFTL